MGHIKMVVLVLWKKSQGKNVQMKGFTRFKTIKQKILNFKVFF